jgi:hypothetical protein
MNLEKHLPNLLSSSEGLENKKSEQKQKNLNKESKISFLKKLGRKALPYLAIGTVLGKANEVKAQNNGYYFDNSRKEWIYKAPEKKQDKNTHEIKSVKKEKKEVRLGGGPPVDDFEYYDASDVYKDKDTSVAMQNYNKGPSFFKYHKVRESFKGMNSSFWRKRVAEGLDTKLPLRPGESVRATQHDMLAICKFSVRDGVEDARAIFIKKGTLVIFDADGKIIAIRECVNPVLTSHTICPPCPPGAEKKETYNE